MCSATKQKNMAWRFSDHPMPGWIYRLPDIPELVRGVTFTIIDGNATEVPSMQRNMVRASSEGHADKEHDEIVEALQNLIGGRRAQPGDAERDGAGRHRRRVPQRAEPQNRNIRGAAPGARRVERIAPVAQAAAS